MLFARFITPVLVTVTLPRSVPKAPVKLVFAVPEFIVTSVVSFPPVVPEIAATVIAPSSVVRVKSAASASTIPASKSKVDPSPSVSIFGSAAVNLIEPPLLKIVLPLKLYSVSTPVAERVISPLVALPIEVAPAPFPLSAAPSLFPVPI